MTMSNSILEKLNTVLIQRKNAHPQSSYVATLYAAGLDSILKKIGEEATETILAAKDNDKQAIVHETADLWFHCMVMLAEKNISPNEVLTELESRFGLSGHEEKANRES